MEDIERYVRSLGDDLGESLAPRPSGGPYMRYGTIATVNSNGTLDVTIDGTTLRGVCATTGCVGAAVGMRCVVLRQGPLATVVGLVASHDLGNIVLPNRKSIFGTDSNGVPLYVFEPRNLNNNAAINFHGYADANSSTEIYGDTIYLDTNNGVRVDGHYLPDGHVSAVRLSSNNEVTTTSSVTLMTLTHTSKTGNVLIFADAMIKTSKNTSTIRVFQGNTQLMSQGTNITSPVRVNMMFHATHARNTQLTYTLRMFSQDTSTTATKPSYNTSELVIFDV